MPSAHRWRLRSWQANALRASLVAPAFSFRAAWTTRRVRSCGPLCACALLCRNFDDEPHLQLLKEMLTQVGGAVYIPSSAWRGLARDAAAGCTFLPAHSLPLAVATASSPTQVLAAPKHSLPCTFSST